MFRLILLIYDRIMKNYLSQFMRDNLRNSIIVNLTKKRFLQQVRGIELIN